MHSLFKQVDVYLNGKQVTPAMGTYAYRAYIETLLNYDVSAKESQLTSALYYKDTPGHMDETGSLPSEKTITYATAQTGKATTADLQPLPLSYRYREVEIKVSPKGVSLYRVESFLP